MIVFGDRLGLRQRQQVGEIASRHPREGEMLAVGRRLEPFDDRRHLVEIGEIERHIGAEREPDPVRGQWDPADEVEDLGAVARHCRGSRDRP